MTRMLALMIAVAAAMGFVCQGAEAGSHPRAHAPAGSQQAAPKPFTPGALDDLITSGAPECVPVKTITKLPGVSEFDLNERQFEFLRAMYVALPPVSRKLPAGDRAALFGDPETGAVMAGIIDGVTVCARFILPDFVQQMLIDVGAGKTETKGDKV